MVERKFELKPVEYKPISLRKSIYDPIIDTFLAGKEDLVELRVEGKDPRVLRQILSLRIRRRELSDKIRVFVSGGKVYLERLKP
jgi:hypothetical protein